MALKHITYFGTQYSDNFVQSKKIILTNQVILLLIAMTLLESIIYLSFKLFIAFTLSITITLMYIGCLFLNKVGKLSLVRYLFLILFNSAIFFYAGMLGKDYGMQYVYFVSMIIPLVIFDKGMKKSKVIFSGIPFFCLTLFEYLNFSWTKLAIPQSFQTPFYLMILTGIGLSIIGIFYFYFNLYEETKKTLNHIFKTSSLTQREIEIVSKIIEGLSNKEIGTILFIEESTVKRHIKNIFKKLNIKKRTELLAFSFEK